MKIFICANCILKLNIYSISFRFSLDALSPIHRNYLTFMFADKQTDHTHDTIHLRLNWDMYYNKMNINRFWCECHILFHFNSKLLLFVCLLACLSATIIIISISICDNDHGATGVEADMYNSSTFCGRSKCCRLHVLHSKAVILQAEWRTFNSRISQRVQWLYFMRGIDSRAIFIEEKKEFYCTHLWAIWIE